MDGYRIDEGPDELQFQHDLRERSGRHAYYNSVDYDINNPEEAHEAYMAQLNEDNEDGMSEIHSPMVSIVA
jgi:hypothetical protein